MKRLFLRKKFIFRLFIGIAIFAAIILLININVTTRQGINYQVITIRIPLYLKIFDFIDRHCNYKQLVQRIIKNGHDKQKKVMKIFSWTYHNIRKQPKTLPVIDDHVWHIIVRGYGVSDQSCDVFTTLCNYAGADAFYDYVFAKDKRSKILLSFVKLKNDWYIFDPYNGIYFEDSDGILADIVEIKKGSWKLKNIGEPKNDLVDYKNYIENIPDNVRGGLKKAHIQSPLRRFVFELQKLKR